jgi:hypothetical protein
MSNEKKYTIKDLSEERVAVKNDGTKEQIKEVISKAFPKFPIPLGTSIYYFRNLSGNGDWTDQVGKPEMPTQSVADFLSPVQTEEGEDERILCAAIWYKDLALVKKYEENCRPYNCDRGIVFCGWRHANCLYSKCSITGLRDAESGDFIQGFLTSKNRFVDRKEAYTIAYRQNQIIGPNKGRETNEIGLTSEDIY